MGIIISSGSGSFIQFRNQSGVGHDLDKLAQDNGPWEEIAGYKEQFRKDDLSAVRYFKVEWNGRAEFHEYFLGYSTGVAGGVVNGSATPPTITRIIPAQHPERPYLYAMEIELVEGRGAVQNNPLTLAQAPDGSPEFDENGNSVPIPMIQYYDNSSMAGPGYGIYAVTYRAVPYEIRSDKNLASYNGGLEIGRNVERKTAYASQNLPIPANGLVFADTGELIPETGPGRILSIIDATYIWHEVPDPPYAAFDACTGAVNQAPFDGASGYRTYPPGTLLCMTPKIERYRANSGRINWEIVYRLLFKTQGWNYFPDLNGTWRLVIKRNPVTGALGGPIYQSADFNTLFEAVAPGSY